MGQRLLSQVEIDQRRDDTNLGQAEPEADKLWPILHEDADVVPFTKTSFIEEVGHLVGVLFYLLKRPRLVFEDETRLLWVLLQLLLLAKDIT